MPNHVEHVLVPVLTAILTEIFITSLGWGDNDLTKKSHWLTVLPWVIVLASLGFAMATLRDRGVVSYFCVAILIELCLFLPTYFLGGAHEKDRHNAKNVALVLAVVTMVVIIAEGTPGTILTLIAILPCVSWLLLSV